MDAHLLRDQVGHRRGTHIDGFGVQKPVDGHRRLVAVRHRRDDVLRAEGRIAAEEHVGNARLESLLAQLGQAPLVEGDAAIALDPGEGVLLADGNQHLVALEEGIRLAGGYQGSATAIVVGCLDDAEGHAQQLAALLHERLGHVEIDDRDAFVLRVFLLPG